MSVVPAVADGRSVRAGQRGVPGGGERRGRRGAAARRRARGAGGAARRRRGRARRAARYLCACDLCYLSTFPWYILICIASSSKWWTDGQMTW